MTVRELAVLVQEALDRGLGHLDVKVADASAYGTAPVVAHRVDWKVEFPTPLEPELIETAYILEFESP